MRAFWAQVKLLILEHLRLPSYLVATVGFPTLFFLIFAVPEANTEALANFLMASFLGFAIMGVMFLQFAHGLAEERNHAWHLYLRTLPIPRSSFFLSRMFVAGFMAFLTALTLTSVAVALTPVSLLAWQWVELYVHLFVGGLCFAAMGMALGVWVSDKVALPLGNMIYLPLSYAGGLWKPPQLLSDSVQKISKYLPSRAYGELLWDTVNGNSMNSTHYSQLGLWMAVFLVLAFVGYRRQATVVFGG